MIIYKSQGSTLTYMEGDLDCGTDKSTYLGKPGKLQYAKVYYKLYYLVLTR